MSNEAIVDIVDVVPEAVKIKGYEMKVGDRVFDALGGTHEVVKTRRLVALMKFKRDDQDFYEYIGHAETITVVRANLNTP